ncbi:MAG: oligosaccharide flippase family protein [Aliidongia sp.]
MALAGYGVWALALQVLAQRTAEFAIVWIFAPVRMGLVGPGIHFRELIPIGMNVFAGRFMSFAGGQLPRIILGYVMGPVELGLFTLATRFQEIAIQTAVQPFATVARIELRTDKPGSAEFEHIFSS